MFQPSSSLPLEIWQIIDFFKKLRFPPLLVILTLNTYFYFFYHLLVSFQKILCEVLFLGLSLKHLHSSVFGPSLSFHSVTSPTTTSFTFIALNTNYIHLTPKTLGTAQPPVISLSSMSQTLGRHSRLPAHSMVDLMVLLDLPLKHFWNVPDPGSDPALLPSGLLLWPH